MGSGITSRTRNLGTCRAVIGLIVWLASGALLAAAPVRRVNAPYFADAVSFPEAAVFWFGQVDSSQNYADVRVAYTNQELWISLEVFDQWLWEDDSASRTAASLEQWDAATLVIDTSSTPGSAPATSAYRFVGELSWWRPRTDYQAAYQGTGTAWALSLTTPFTTDAGWRGSAPNDNIADRGWVITFHIPFSSLGLSGPPHAGSVWRLGLQLHDKDLGEQPAVAGAAWPDSFVRDQPATWGELAIGLRINPTNQVPPSASTYTIRHGLNDIIVKDAMVGGGATCGSELTDYFGQWGAENYAQETTLVTQNQSDVGDWPCFSKVYMDFPLDSLPPGKAVVGATLTVYQFGGSEPSAAQRSLVQVMTVAEPWDEATITWNNAPLALENVSQAWVDPILTPLPWPGAARTWNLTWAVSQAYRSGQSVLRLALYEADDAYHSGKYFTSSDTGVWNEVGRPTLQVTLGDLGSVPPAALPAPAGSDDMLTLDRWRARNGTTIQASQTDGDRTVTQLVFPANTNTPGPANAVELTRTTGGQDTLYGFGQYRASLKAAAADPWNVAPPGGGEIRNEGIVSAFFTYWSEWRDFNANGVVDPGEWADANWNGRVDNSEIDVELLGQDPSAVYLTVWTSPTSRKGRRIDLRSGEITASPDYSVVIDALPADARMLDFDCTTNYYVYGFTWTRSRVSFTLFDGTRTIVLWTLDEPTEIPTHPAYLLLNVWYADDWNAPGQPVPLLPPDEDAVFSVDWVDAPARLGVVSNFDGDGQADVAVYRPATGSWFWLMSSTSNQQYGYQGWGVQAQGDLPVPGDYDGDGISDPAVYRPATGTWFIVKSSSHYADWQRFGWGNAKDVLVQGDYDGDGMTDGAVYRPSTGEWFIRPSSGATQWKAVFGQAGDVPLPADYDGDGKTDIAVYRPASGTWFILKSSTDFMDWTYQGWGVQAEGDLPVPGDYDGDGKTDLAVYRPASGTWFILKSSTNNTGWISDGWGVATDTPAPADYDGDGKTDLAIYRPSTGEWWVHPSSDMAPWIAVFGQSGDVPLQGIR
jgi:hypothetical protein